MFTFLKKTARVITHSILSLLAVGIVLLILLQIALVGTFLWLNTGKGRAIIEKELQLIMAETGQDITIGRLFYDPARGLNIYDVTLRDKTGPLITLDRLSARVAFEKITARILDLDIDGGTLTIHRLPPGSSTDSEMQPFAIPDIYFQRINISRLTFNEINVAEAVFGTALSLSPTLRADMTLGDIITLKISLSPQLIMADIPVPPPEAITLSAQLNPQTLALTINEARIKSSAYQLDGKGETMLGNNGALTFTLTGAYDDLRALTGNQLASTNFNATIGGILDTPSLTLQGVLTPATLAENGVEDIKFNITPLLNSPDIAADIIITTTFKDQPVTIKSRALYDAPYLRLSDLNATAPHLDVKGTIALDTNTTLAEGTLSIATDDLSYYNSLTGQDISGALKGTLALTTTDGLQSLSTNFTADNARYTTTTAKQLSGDIAIADIRNPWPHKATITTNRLALSPSMTVDKGTLSITADGAQSYALTLSGNGTMQQPFSFNGNAAISNLTAVFPTIRNAALDLNVQKSTMNVTGDLSPEAINITAKTQNFSLTAIPATIPDALANGLLSGTITMTGTPAAPITKGDITIGNLDTGAYKAGPGA
ncbi:MAG: hypothetical protein KJ667_00140 [Alphaproteobacteria bacterium]|nr:hypothetical protein [Alphaproteobacteria bacterium]